MMKAKRRVNKKSVTLTCSVSGAEIRQHLLQEKQRKLLLLKAAEALVFDDREKLGDCIAALVKQQDQPEERIMFEILQAVVDVIIPNEDHCCTALCLLLCFPGDDTGIYEAVKTARETLEAEVS